MQLRGLIAIGVAIAALAFGAPVWAQSADALKKAQASFDAAQTEYLQGNYDAAAKGFQEAYSARPFPQFLYNVGASLHRAGDTMGAVKAYQQYLNALPEAADADKVRKAIQILLERSGDALMKP